MYKTLSLIAALLMLNALNVYAETLILNDGRKIEGKIIEKTDDAIKIEVNGSRLTYYIDQIKSIEKDIPAVIVKDEEQKEELIEQLTESQAVDQIYVVKKEQTAQAEQTVLMQQKQTQQLDAPAQPSGNVAIQFKSAAELYDEEQERINNMTPEERELHEKREAAAQQFYDSW